MGILMAVLGFLGAIALSLVNDEIRSWLPKLTQRILDRAVQRHPAEEQDHYALLWQAHISEYPGKLSQLYQAIKLSKASISISNEGKSQSPLNIYYMVIITQISSILTVYIDIKEYGLRAFSRLNIFLMTVMVILAVIVIIKYIRILIREKREMEIRRITDLPAQQ